MPATTINIVKAVPVDTLPTKYAKLTRPAIHDVLPRTRLFTKLDQLRKKHQIIWISSPPGAGKTTLAASYLAATQSPSLWYQVDESDNDAATLFFFLQEALHTLPAIQGKSRLELANAEISPINRLFFRDFYAHLPPDAIVVLDNLHEFDWKNSGALMEYAFSEIPSTITVIALSREAPAARLSKMELSGQLSVLGWNDMRLDNDEVLAMVAIHRATGQPEEQLDQNLIASIDGWAAGVILLKASKDSKATTQFSMPEENGREALFRYFTGEIFERMPLQSQRMLMQLSCLQSFSVQDAQALTQDPGVTDLLKNLYKSNFFIELRDTDNNQFQLHALFREFLQFEFSQRIDSTERIILFEHAAYILEANGRIEEAAELLQGGEKHLHLINLLLKHASTMMDNGRGQLWRDWMSSLPLDLIDQQPELWYWHGVSLNDVAPRRARQILIRAERAFDASGKLRSRLLTIAAIMHGFEHEWSDQHLLLPWIAQLSAGLSSLDEELADPDLDLILYSRLLLALIITEPASAQLLLIAERVQKNLPLAQNPVEQLNAGGILLKFFDTGFDDINFAAIRQLVEQLNQCANNLTISPFLRVKWFSSVAHRYSKNGYYQESQQFADATKDIVNHFNLEPHLFLFIESYHLISVGNLDSARTRLDQLLRSTAVLKSTELMDLYTLEANWHALNGDMPGALTAIEAALLLCSERLLPPVELSKLEIFQAGCHALLSDFDAVESSLLQAEKHAYRYDQSLINEARQFLLAFQLWKNDDSDHALKIIDTALQSHCQRQATTLFPMLPILASQIALIALQGRKENQQQTQHITQIIHKQKLHSPDRFISYWPWPVTVRAFGKFELAIHNVLFLSAGKSQQRPLMLLKALISCGDRGNTMETIATQLWPDSEDARSTLNVTVFRLRKILVTPNVILVAGGKIQLSDNHVWSDLMAFTNLCDEIEYLKADAPTSSIQKLAVELLDLYRGPFCEDEHGSWVLPVRERLKVRFLSATQRIGLRLEANRHSHEAIALYQRAIEAEPLAESCYRGLMRCMHADGDTSAALNAFRRCRHMLSIMAGLNPSIETINLSIALGLKL